MDIDCRNLTGFGDDMLRVHMKKRVLADAAACSATLFFSFWLYEAGNWVVLTAEGAKATLVWNGFLPAGVFTVTQGGGDLLGAKLLQIGICGGVTLAALRVMRSRELQMTTISLGALTGVYFSSFYWEILSFVGTIPLVIHEAIFAGISVTTGAVVLKALVGPLNPARKAPDFTVT